MRIIYIMRIAVDLENVSCSGLNRKNKFEMGEKNRNFIFCGCAVYCCRGLK